VTGDKLTILCILDGFTYGGDENRVLQIARTIDRDRFDFRVASIRPEDTGTSKKFGNLRGEFEQAGVTVVDLSVPRITRGLPLNDWRRHFLRVGLLAGTVGRIIRYAKRERVDVIDGHHGAGYLAGTVAGKIARVPSLLTTYNVDEMWQPEWLWKIVRRSTLALSGAVITDSEPVADDLRSWLVPAKRSRVRVIPNGPPAPAAERSESDVRHILGLPTRGETRVIGQIAALSRGKGQHLLLEAAPKILERHPDVTFLIVGFERPVRGYGDVLRARAKELGIDRNVIITPYQGCIGDVWQTVDIQAHPTMRDSLPNAILEGMSLGKPLVASAHAGIPSLVINERTGLVVPVDNAPALANGLIRLLDQPQVARDFGEAARARYLGGYTAEHLARRMEDVFVEIAGVCKH
jgi:glycosyltransferase involved in cell wall biosynthesis